jgi:glycosyltransferase involved in cell wall biosynthesis
MKLAWLSNDPWTNSGYGMQTRLILPRLRDAGHDICMLSNWGLQGGKIEWKGIPCYPCFMAPHATDVLIPHANEFFGGPQHGLVISLLDIWVADATPFALTHWLAWTPVDHDPISDVILNKLKTGHALPVSLSKWGQTQLRTAGLENADYIPCVIDTKIMKPGDQNAARELLGLPKDSFIVGMVAVNKGTPSRKSFPEVLSAFKKFHDVHPDSYLYLHTEITGKVAGNGLFLRTLVDTLDIPKEAVIFADQYKYIVGYPEEEMAAIFQSIDVLCSPSMAEGFGVPIVEAQAAGKPVITSQHSSMPELTKVGWSVDGPPVYLPIGAWAILPNVDQITAALFEAHEKRGDPVMAQEAREFALQFDVDTVIRDFWLPKIAGLESEIKPYEIVPEMEYFRELYGLQLRHRYHTFLRALDMLTRGNNGRVIVETGTMRGAEVWQTDGGSTYLFAEYASKNNGKVYSVDISPISIAKSKLSTLQWTDYVTHHEGDSVSYLESFPDKIGLLYLDSLDCTEAEQEAQEHQRNELLAAWNKLEPGSIVLLDDNSVGAGGKTVLSKQVLKERGAECLVDAYQSLWRIPA